MSEDELETLKRKVENLEKRTETIATAISMANQIFMSLFERVRANTDKMISLLEQLPTNMAKEAIEQIKKASEEYAEKLEKARTNLYVS